MRKKSIITIIAILAMAVTALICLSACEEEYNIDHLEIYSSPRTDYFVGEEFDYSGASIRVVYTNGTDRIVQVDGTMISSFDSSVLGSQYIKIYYRNHSVSVKVNVNRYATASSALEIPDTNYNLIEGQPLNLNDSYLLITFEDGSVRRIPITESMCSGYDAGRVGSQDINVSYTFPDGEVVNVSFSVTVEERAIESVSIQTLPDRSIYYQGDREVALEGGELHVVYNNGYTERLPMVTGGALLEGLEVVSFDSSVESGSVKVALRYYNFDISFNVSVEERDIRSFVFDKDAIPVQLEGTVLNLDGMLFSITYTNDEQLLLEAGDENFGDYIDIRGYDPSRIGTQELVISFLYGGVELATKWTMSVTVRERSLMEIGVSGTNPVIYLGSDYELNEFNLELRYDNGNIDLKNLADDSVRVVDVTGSGQPEEVTGSFVYYEHADRVWRVVYTETDAEGTVTEYECEHTFEVTIPEVVSHEFSGYDAEGSLVYFEYVDGEPRFTAFADGLKLKLTYNSGVELTRELDSLSGSGYEIEVSTAAESAGKAIADLTIIDIYGADRAEYTIEGVDAYVARTIERVTVTAAETFDCHLVPEDTFSDQGLTIEVKYLDSEEITYSLPDPDFYAAFYFLSEGAVDIAGGILMFPEEGEYLVTVGSADITENTEIIYPGNSDEGGIAITVDSLPDSVIGVYTDDKGLNEVGMSSSEPGINVPYGTDIPLDKYYLGVRYTGKKDGAEIIKYFPLSDKRIEVSSTKEMGTGPKEITITFEDEGTKISSEGYYVYVSDRVPVGITVTLPKTVFYYYPNNDIEQPSTSGVIIRVNYDNGTFETIAYTDAEGSVVLTNYSWSNDLSEREQEVTITYSTEGVVLQTTATIYLKEAMPRSITWGLGTAMYATIGAGVEFSLENLSYAVIGSDGEYITQQDTIVEKTITATYETPNGLYYSTETVRDILDEITFDPASFNSNSLVAQGVRLSYLGCTFTINVKIIHESSLTSVTMNTERFSVIRGGTIDINELVLNLHFGELVYQVPMREEYFVKAADLQADEQGELTGIDVILHPDTTPAEYKAKVSYTYNGVTCTTEVIVEVLQRKLIEIQFMNVKTEFMEHEEFETGDGSYILAIYDNGRQDVVHLTDAVIYDGSDNLTNDSFYVDIRSFDNSEIASGGKVKQQAITIYYTDNKVSGGESASDTYIIYMRDRRYPTVTFTPDNVFERTYKDEGASAPVSLTVTGYHSYSDEGKDFQPWNGEGEPDYYEYELYFIGEDGTEYGSGRDVKFPINAGVYDIVVRYKGDPLHNPIEVRSETPLTILKRSLTITFTDGEFESVTSLGKIYGEATEKLYVSISGLAEGDEYEAVYGTLEDNCLTVYPNDHSAGLSIFDIAYLDLRGNVVGMEDRTAAGNYVLALNPNTDKVSVNYEIVVKGISYNIEKRPVKVYADSIEVSYGDPVPRLTFTYEEDEEDIGYERGVLDGETLSGELRRESGSNAGVYPINAGTLSSSNPNYDIEFYEGAEDTPPTVTIVARQIYIRIVTDSVIYGTEYVAPAVMAEYFRDAALGDSENVFAQADIAAYGDDPEAILGELTIIYRLNGETVAEPWKQGVNEYEVGGEFLSASEAVRNNYKWTFVFGSLTVTKRNVSVEVLSVSTEYGIPVGEIAFEYRVEEQGENSGLMEGDELRLKFGVAGSEDEDILGYGAHSIDQIVTGEENANYEPIISFAMLTVTAKALGVRIDASALSKDYDGKMPSVSYSSEYISFFDDGEQFVDEKLTAEAGSALRVNISGSSANAGSYAVTVSSGSQNFTFELEESVNFVIDPLEIGLTADDYYYSPEGDEYFKLNGAELVYSGFGYSISARIPEATSDENGNYLSNGLQPVYNASGTPATDDDNNVIFDSVVVTVTLGSVTNAGEYTVKATAFSNRNYTLTDAEELTFKVAQKEVTVYFNTSGADEGAPNTIVRQYTGEPQQFIRGSYEVGEVVNGDYALTDDSVGTVTVVLERNGVAYTDPLQDVVYDASGNPLVYDIKVVSSLDSNYDLKTAEEYKFILNPRSIILKIYPDALTMEYNGGAPGKIESSLFDIVYGSGADVTDAGFEKSWVNFIYSREDNDYRSGSSVGTYSISVSVEDKNFEVSLDSVYKLSITRKEYNFSLSDSSPEKQYDGAGIEFTRNDVTLNIPSNLDFPSIRTFAYDRIMSSEGKNRFVNLMTTADDMLNDIITAYFDVSAAFNTSTGAVGENAEETKVEVEELLAHFTADENLDASLLMNGDALRASLGNLSERLDAIVAAARAGSDIRNAMTDFETALGNFVDIFDEENYYMIFVLGEEGTSEISGTGEYPLHIYANDFNRELVDLNAASGYIVEITPKILEVQIGHDEGYKGSVVVDKGNVIAEYGDVPANASEEPFIPYRIYDPVRGEYLERVVGKYNEDNYNEDNYNNTSTEYYFRYKGEEENVVYIYGNLHKVAGTAISSYPVLRGTLEVYTDAQHNTENANYQLTFNVGSYIVSRRAITLRFEGDETTTDGEPIIRSGVRYGGLLAKNSGSVWSEKLTLAYIMSLPYNENIKDFNYADISYTCYINGSNAINSTATAAGIFELEASLPGSAAPNYSITILPAKIKIEKAQLRMGYTVSGATKIDKQYGETIDQEWIIGNISYTGFIGNDNAGSVVGYPVDKDGNRIEGVGGSPLSMIAWDRTWYQGLSPEPIAIDPAEADTPVGNYKLEFSKTSGNYEYVFDNYEIDFGGTQYSVNITARPLTLSLISDGNGSDVITYYGGIIPSAEFEFVGYIDADEDEVNTLLGSVKYNDDYCSGSNVGTVTLGSNFVTNFSEIQGNDALSNYSLSFSGSVRVLPIPISVSIEDDGLAALYYFDGSKSASTFGPYSVGYQYEVVEIKSEGETYKTYKLVDGTTLEITSGVYGVEDFVFEISESDKELLAKYGVTTETINLGELKGGVKKYASGQFMPDVDNALVGTVLTGSEPLNYMSLYEHTYQEVDGKKTIVEDGEYYTYYTLGGMSLDNSNYTLSYPEFRVRMVLAVDAVLASLNEKIDLTEDDIVDFITNGNEITDLMRQNIYFSALSYYTLLQDWNMVIYDDPDFRDTAFAKNIEIEVPNVDLNKTDITFILKLWYSINGIWGTSIGEKTHQTYTFVTSPDSPTEYTVRDMRKVEYTSEETFTILPVRFFGKSYAKVDDPEFGLSSSPDNLLAYDKRTDFTGAAYYSKQAFDIASFTFRAELPSDPSHANLRFMVNGGSSGFVGPGAIYIEFDRTSYNKFRLVYVTDEGKDEYDYHLNFGYIFDGRSHTLEFELQKAINAFVNTTFTFVAKIDGKAGAIVNLTDIFQSFMELVGSGTNASVFAEDDNYAGIQIYADDFVLYSAMLKKKGRFDNSGIIASIRNDCNPVFVVGEAGSVTSDYARLSVTTLHELFGLVYGESGSSPVVVPDGYEYRFYIDGEPFSMGAEVELAVGRHKLEVGIYFGGTLVDADMIFVDVVSMMPEGDILMHEFDDQGRLITEESDAKFDGVRDLEFAKYEETVLPDGTHIKAADSGEEAATYIQYTKSKARPNYISAMFTVEPVAERIVDEQGILGGVTFPETGAVSASLPVIFRMALFEVQGNDELKQVNFTLVYHREPKYEYVGEGKGDYSVDENGNYYPEENGDYIRKNIGSLSELNYSLYPAIEYVYSTETGGTATTGELFMSGSGIALNGTDRPMFNVAAFVDKNSTDRFGSGNMVVQFTAEYEGRYFSDIGVASPYQTYIAAAEPDAATARLGISPSGTGNDNVPIVAMNSDLGARATVYDISLGTGIPGGEISYMQNFTTNATQFSPAESRDMWVWEGPDSVEGEWVYRGAGMYFLSLDGKAPTPFRYNGITGAFDGSESFTVYLLGLSWADPEPAESYVSSEPVASIEYDAGRKEMTFSIIMREVTNDETKTMRYATQTIPLSSDIVTGENTFTLSYNTDLRNGDGYMQQTSDLYSGGDLLVQADSNNPVWVQKLTLTVNESDHTLYCPLFDDLAGWKWETEVESGWGSGGKYGNATPEEFEHIPTFLSYTGYIAVEKWVSEGSTRPQEGETRFEDLFIYLNPILGEDHTRDPSAIQGTPEI